MHLSHLTNRSDSDNEQDTTNEHAITARPSSPESVVEFESKYLVVNFLVPLKLWRERPRRTCLLHSI